MSEEEFEEETVLEEINTQDIFEGAKSSSIVYPKSTSSVEKVEMKKLLQYSHHKQEIVVDFIQPFRISPSCEEITPIVLFVVGLCFLHSPIISMVCGILGYIPYKNSRVPLSKAFARLNFALFVIAGLLFLPTVLAIFMIFLPSPEVLGVVGTSILGVLFFVCFGCFLTTVCFPCITTVLPFILCVLIVFVGGIVAGILYLSGTFG